MNDVGRIVADFPRNSAKVAGVLLPANLAVLGRTVASLRRDEPWRDYCIVSGIRPDDILTRGLGWLLRSSERARAGGIASYDFYRWMHGYPEVTGYAIPTIWDCYHHYEDACLSELARRLADWELRIQTPCGGWEGGSLGDGKPPVVFNTGQVMRGLIRTFDETQEECYLESARRSGDWLVSTQEPDGSWSKTNFRGMKRVYDSYVAAPLVLLAHRTSDDRYAEAARRNCDFVLEHQRRNGWFELCDNSPHYNDAPVTHTLCYTADGLMETGQLLDEERYVAAGARTVEALAECVEPGGYLAGRFTADWKPAVEWVCITGSAQLGVMLAGSYRATRGDGFAGAAEELLDFLAYCQHLTSVGRERSGGLAGSYPIWGSYAPLRWPCWATKYLLDFVLLLMSAPTPVPAAAMG